MHKKILLVYYHPVIWDIAQTFRELGCRVTVAVNPQIKDNYGTGLTILEHNRDKYKDIDVVPLPIALALLKKRQYDLVGCDGVFDGDKMVMEVASQTPGANTPYFCIGGYPNVMDEPSDNILSLGWFTPTMQYNQRYPHEGHKKEIDWKNISQLGRSEGKNFCVFYPNFWEFKVQRAQLERLPFDPPSGFISLVQGYERWNKFSFETFQQLEKSNNIQNLEGKPSEEVFFALKRSKALLMLKWADQPGIALFEAMLLGKPVLTMISYVYASMNPEVLIPHYNSIVANDIEELKEYMRPEHNNYLFELGQNARDHANMLTNFGRQRINLIKFIDRCLNV